MFSHKMSLLVIGVFVIFLGISSCKEKGAGEKAGEQIDKAVEEVGKAAEEAAKKLQ